MTTIRRINVSQIDGNDANVNDTDEIRPFGETAFYLDTDRNPSALALMMFDGVRTHRRSKILRPGIFYGSNGDSSDGLGYDTIKLIPDSVLDFDSEYTNDQYIIIEPTYGEPGHVHIRSGGTIDNSTADLFLGGELNHIKVSDTNDTVIISTDAGGEGATREWAFSPSGHLQFPGGSNGRIGEDEPGLVVYSNLNFGILTNLANTENSKSWIFTDDGDLTLPQGGTISETTIGMNPTVVIKPAEADSPNQALYVKGGLPPEPGDYHLHLTTGDLTDTSIIVGTDDHNIRTTIDGGIELNSYNYGTSVQHTLTFGTDGALTTAEAFSINVLAGIPDSISNIDSAGGWNNSPYTNLATTGGTGTGLTVDASSEGSGYLNTITINTAGSGYANGDVITIENENNLTATFTIGIAAPNTWSFGIDGELTTPGNIEVAGVLKIDNGVHEKFQTKVDATGTITHDCSAGHIFYHTSPDANWTANFTNLNLNSTYATAITLVIVQGGTGYYPSALEIGGVSQTINWQGNATPTPSINRVDVVTFSILNNSGTYTVLGQLTGF